LSETEINARRTGTRSGAGIFFEATAIGPDDFVLGRPYHMRPANAPASRGRSREEFRQECVAVLHRELRENMRQSIAVVPGKSQMRHEVPGYGGTGRRWSAARRLAGSGQAGQLPPDLGRLGGLEGEHDLPAAARPRQAREIDRFLDVG
jgi:hypothetical protein